MAQRFGGKYSPNGPAPRPQPPQRAGDPGDGPHPFDGRRRTRAGSRANMLFFVPFVFLVGAFSGEPGRLILSLGALGTLLLAAWLTREGIFAHEAYDARRVARRPALPRKILGSLLTGAGLALGTLAGGEGALFAGLFAVIGAGLHLLAFGPDPLRDKGMEGIDAFQTDRVARAVDEAEKRLSEMKDAILRAGDRGLEARVDRFAQTARGLFRTIEGDPGDLTAARKYLSVYLAGARDATAKFADFYAQNRNAAARADYEALLDDLETTFASRTTDLLENNRTDLDVEIQVLRERLQFETPKVR